MVGLEKKKKREKEKKKRNKSPSMKVQKVKGFWLARELRRDVFVQGVRHRRWQHNPR